MRFLRVRHGLDGDGLGGYALGVRGVVAKKITFSNAFCSWAFNFISNSLSVHSE